MYYQFALLNVAGSAGMNPTKLLADSCSPDSWVNRFRSDGIVPDSKLAPKLMTFSVDR
jgi:hypothetical protein